MGLRIGFGQTRRFACVVLAACLVFSAIGSLSLPEPVFAFSGGTGTSSDPYQITTAADLAGISAYLGSGNASKYFKLMNNIDLSAYSTGSGWTPLGAYPNYFYGHFDGNYKTISNLYVNSSGTSYVGLFGYVGTGGVIQNTTLSNVNVTGAIDVGALAGENNGTVQQSGVSGGTVTGTERVGGLVGSNQGAMAYDYANVSVTFNPPVASASCCSGGLAGEAFGSTAATIHDSYSRSSVYIGVATPYDQGSVGGLLGNDYNSGSKSNLYSTGPVTVVSGSLPSGTGGLSGGQYTSIASSYWDTQSSGLATSMGGAGVVGETTAAMKTQSTYSGWDFTTIWAIDGSGTINNGYPYLQWQANTSSNPNTPSALGPAGVVGGGYGTSSQPVFSFTLSDPNGSATVKYEIQIDTSGTFASPVVDYTSALGSQGSFGFTVGQAAGSGTYAAGSAGQTLADGAYYWRVKTIDNSNNSSGFSSANAGGIAFKVDATPPVTPGTPASAASQTPATDTDWTWTASSDSGSGLASPAYTVQWSQDSSFATGLHTATSATNALAIGSLADGMWYVRVRAADGAGNNSAYSPAGNVLVDTTAPSIPGRPTPATATTDTTPVWAWTASSDTGSGLAATPYTVEWSQDAGFTSGVSSAVAGSHAFTMPSALADGTWYLRVKAEDAVGNFSPYSAAGSIVLARAASAAGNTAASLAAASTDQASTIGTTPAMQPAPSPSKAVDTLLLLNDFSSYTSGTGKMVQLGASQSVTFRVQAVTHTAVVSDVGGDYAVLTIHSTPQTLHLNVGETKRVDANGDGIPDVSITLESIHNGVAQLRFAEITQAAVYLSASARPLMRTQSGRYAAYGVGTSMCVLLLVIALYIIRRRRSK